MIILCSCRIALYLILVSKLEALAKKYETTFADVENQIEETEKSLSSMIDDLEGSEF